MKSQVGPGSKELTSVDDFKVFTSKDDIVIVGFFKKDSELKTNFLNLADKMREKITFGHSTTEDVLSVASITYCIFIVYFSL